LTGRRLLDTSAWVRFGHPGLGVERAETIAGAVEAGQIVICLPFLLEAGYSARDGAEHDRLLEELGSLPRVLVDEEVERRALDAQRQLARIGHHRLPPVDLLVAALADRHGIGVLHYDRDYDVLASRTDLRFESEWLAERGVL